MPRLPPLLRQLTGDPLGLGSAAQSRRSRELEPRTATADRVVKSICPYCAVGCGQKVYVKDEQRRADRGRSRLADLARAPVPQGLRLRDLVNSPQRATKVRYRRPGATEWEDLDLDTAMDMIAERILATREQTWEERNADGNPLNRTLGLAFLGGATLDTEENYLIKKCFTAAGAVSIENQARI